MAASVTAVLLASIPLQQPFRRSTRCAAPKAPVCRVLAPERELVTVRQDPSERTNLASDEPLVLWTPRGDVLPISQPADAAQTLRDMEGMLPEEDGLQPEDGLWLSEADREILRQRAAAAAETAAAAAAAAPTECPPAPTATRRQSPSAQTQPPQPLEAAAAVQRNTSNRIATGSAFPAADPGQQPLAARTRGNQQTLHHAQLRAQRAREPLQDQLQRRTATTAASTTRQQQGQQQPTQRARSPLLSQRQQPAQSRRVPAAQRQEYSKQHAPQQQAQRQRAGALHQGQQQGKPPLQQAVRSNSRHDWQVTRDWLVMEMTDMHLDDKIWADITAATSLPKSCRPLVAFYHKLGLRKSEIISMAHYRDQTFKVSLPMVQSRLNFLREEIGFSDDDVRKMMLKFPRIIEYRTERTLRPRLDWLKQQGVEQGDLVKILAKAPSILELSVEDTLEPRAAFLRDVAMVPEDSVSKVLLRSPSCLTCTQELMQERVDFLREQGFDDAQLAKAVTSHPQMLYYRVESMEERVDFLRSIGISDEELATVIVKLPQLLSLNVQDNMMPKYEYLLNRLGGTVRQVATYPAYFSLSLPKRIVPRHRFLEMVQQQRICPFPMEYLKFSDERFAKDVAKSTVEQFESFRRQLQIDVMPSQPMAVQRR